MKTFKKIFVEITNSCNLACSFCHQSGRNKAFMSLPTFEEILRQVKGLTDHLCLHVLGEPLLHPDLERILDACRLQGLRVNLTTNGTLLRRCGAVLLSSEALRQVNISLHSFEAEPEGPSMESYLDDVLSFMAEARGRSNLFINLRLWNLQQGTEMANRQVLKWLETRFPQAAPIASRCAAGQGIPLASGIFLSQANRFTWPHAPGPDLGDRGTCRGLRDHVAILVDGTLVPCCLDAEADIPLGNIHDLPLSQILESPRAVAIRTGFLQGKVIESLCRRCSFRQRFSTAGPRSR